MLETTSNVVKCCVCGYEHSPAEVFIPKYFFGNPGEVIRDGAGNIEFVTGDKMDLTEEYICDGCGAKLKIKANLTFTTTSEAEVSDEEFVVNFNKDDKIKLKEEDLFGND